MLIETLTFLRPIRNQICLELLGSRFGSLQWLWLFVLKLDGAWLLILRTFQAQGLSVIGKFTLLFADFISLDHWLGGFRVLSCELLHAFIVFNATLTQSGRLESIKMAFHLLYTVVELGVERLQVLGVVRELLLLKLSWLWLLLLL